VPLFEYHCETCGHTIEVLQRDARVLELCGSDCVAGKGDGHLERRMSAHAVLGGGAGESAMSAAEMCGTCGRAPGSCAYDN
jgi:predicted nucleic acid-binding Zn ribbon protein